ncbi:cytochrome P450 4C1-like [Leptidea sinapis]|uniref:cytochrome P450 4C1-like n=1 Tax=Leptidea sinapis TaxID=189913 RepID=UPI00213A388B|nr:cytochrome P450 4C1-like [Leptidea sinapis]
MMWPLILILCYCIFRYRRRRLYKHASKVIKHQWDLPFIGVSWVYVGSTEKILKEMQDYSKFTSENGGISVSWMGPKLFYTITDPAIAEVVLKNNLEKDDLMRIVHELLGDASIVASVSNWKPRRKISVRAFSPKILSKFVKIFAENSATLAKELDKKAGTGNFKIWPQINAYALDAILESSMGVQINAQLHNNNELQTAVNTTLQMLSERTFRVWYWPDWIYKHTSHFAKLQSHIKIIHDFTNEVIRKKRLLHQVQAKFTDQEELEYNNSLNFLDLLMSLSSGEKAYTDVELREEVLTFVLAGMDTSAVAIGFFLKLMGKYPAVQQKVYNELQEVFGDSDRILEKEDLPKLQYLERAIKETLRLYCSVPFILRRADTDILLPDGTTIPESSSVLISILGMHRSAKNWGTDADCFDPDRFLPDRIKDIHPTAYIPFSFGPRNCVGYQYAMMSIKTASSTILRRHKIVGIPEPTSKPNIKLKYDIMLKDVDGYEIALERRQ